MTHSAALSETYWIIGARVSIRRIVKSCSICIRYRGELSNQVMGDLPRSKVNPEKHFSRTGIHCAGPFQVCPRRGRRTSYRVVCLCVRMFHHKRCAS